MSSLTWFCSSLERNMRDIVTQLATWHFTGKKYVHCASRVLAGESDKMACRDCNTLK